MLYKPVQYGSEEHAETIALRDEILRKPLGLEYSPEDLAAESDSFHLSCWDDDVLLGCLVLKPLTATSIRMRQVAVRKEQQGKGVGNGIVKYSEQFAIERGYNNIVLHARETALGFYQKLGYEAEGERFTEIGLPHFSMRKVLSHNTHI